MSDHQDEQQQSALPRAEPADRAALEKVLTLDNQLCFALHSASHAFQRAYKPLLDKVNLTYPQYLVMLLLWQRGQMGVKALGDALFLDSGTLSPLLKRLEQAGHVERQRDGRDERQVKISLTPSGAALKEQAIDIMGEISAKTGCSAAEAAGLRQRLHALRMSLES